MKNASEVIKNVEGCVTRENFSCADCPYHYFHRGYCHQRLLSDALTVLKNQATEIEKYKKLLDEERDDSFVKSLRKMMSNAESESLGDNSKAI